MPLARYFLYVGGVLLTLVFILDACLTSKLPVIERSHANSPVIRIHSDRKWPERIVFDTALPIIVSAPVIVEDVSPNPTTATDVSVKVREREAFALMQPSDAKRLEPSEPRRRELKMKRQRKIVKRHVVPRSVLVARQSQFGWFGNTIW
jgi:hypothetical protein